MYLVTLIGYHLGCRWLTHCGARALARISLNRSNNLRFLIVDLQSCGDEVVTFLDYVTTVFFRAVAGIGKNIRNHCHFCQPLVEEAPLRSGPLLLESGQAVSRLRFN